MTNTLTQKIEENIIPELRDYFNQYENENFIVKNSLPVLYFGNLDEYEKSEIKIITVGLNPSNKEFDESNRFPKWSSERFNLTEVLNDYFNKNPYTSWFSSYEGILNGLDASYYKGKKHRAIHTDLCFPLASDPTWSKFVKQNKEEAKKMKKKGEYFFLKLLRILAPDVILISIGQREVEKIFFKRTLIECVCEKLISFNKKKDGTFRKDPYYCYEGKYDLELEDKKIKPVRLVYGQGSQTPFGSISSEQKEEIGKKILEKLS